MALKARVSQVTYTGAGGVDLSLSGRFVVAVEYFDDATPQTVILSTSFELPSSVTVTEAVQRIQEYGRRVRDARLRVAALQSQVGVSIDV